MGHGTGLSLDETGWLCWARSRPGSGRVAVAKLAYQPQSIAFNSARAAGKPQARRPSGTQAGVPGGRPGTGAAALLTGQRSCGGSGGGGRGDGGGAAMAQTGVRGRCEGLWD